jgi:hypothetical protein
MAQSGRFAIALIAGIAATAILAPGSNAQQSRYNDRSIVSQYNITLAAWAKKKRSVQSSICQSFGNMGWTCYPAGPRTCCCYHSFYGQDCFGLE